jgi:YVTN family beta-propeller protein
MSMTSMRRTLFLAAILLLGAGLQAQATPKPALLALSKKDHTLAIVDPVTLKVVAKVPVGNDPHEVEASADGKIAYVSNYGGGAYNTLAVVDLTRQKALPAIDLGPLRGPHGLMFTAGKIWFTAETAKAIGSYDPASGKIDFILGTGENRTHMIWVSSDVRRIITTNIASGTVSIIEKAETHGPGPSSSDWDETVVKVGRGSEGFDVSPDGNEVWVANAQDATVSIIDPVARKVTETLASNTPGANRLKFTPDGHLVLISSLRNGELTILDARSRKELKRLPLGRGAAGILIQPDGARAFVAVSPDNNVAVIDLKTLEVVKRLDVGVEPDGLAWAAGR